MGTQNFLEVALKETYNETNATSASFEGLISRWTRTQYRPWETLRPFRAKLELTLVCSEDSIILPAAYDYKFLVAGLLASDTDRYLSQFVGNAEPDNNMFRAIDRISWGF